MRVDWWTLALQTANVLVLIWLLARFLFRPVAEIVARRQDEANRLLADAAAVQRQADEGRTDLERARANIETERDKAIVDLRAMNVSSDLAAARQAISQHLQTIRNLQAQLDSSQAGNAGPLPI